MRRVDAGLLDDGHERRRRRRVVVPRRERVCCEQLRKLSERLQPAQCAPARVREAEGLEVLRAHAVRAGGRPPWQKADGLVDLELRGRLKGGVPIQRARELRLAVRELGVHLLAHARIVPVGHPLACEKPRGLREAEAPHHAHSALGLRLLLLLSTHSAARLVVRAVMFPPVHQALEVALREGSKARR